MRPPLSFLRLFRENTLLVSAIIRLEARQVAPLPFHLGRAAHALFLRFIGEADPKMAARLHEDNEAKPFTVSDLMSQSAASRRAATYPGQVYFLRFTTCEAGLSLLLTESVLPNLPLDVEMDGIVFAIKGAVLDPAEHPWAGQTSYSHLSNQGLLGPRGGRESLRLFFASATVFHSKGRNIPLPLPGMVFGSLVERWNSFSTITIPAEVRRYADECLGIAQYSTRSRLVEVAGGKQVGFIGSCSYIPLNRDPYWWRLVNLLADFAFYSGVGAKTTMGMGQCRRLSDASALPYRTRSNPA